MSNFYLQRGDKAIGPLTWDRVESLLQSGKMQPTSKVAESPNGPWISASQMQNQLSTSSAPEIGGSLTGDSLFDAIPPIPASIPNHSYWTPPTAIPKGAPNSTDSTENVSNEASFWLRCVMPWIGENSHARYGNLDRYIAIFKSVNRIGFTLGLVFIALGVIVNTIAWPVVLARAIGDSEFGDVFPRVTAMMFFGYFMSALYLAILHLLYIASMAVCDFLRLLIDVEANTRKTH